MRRNKLQVLLNKDSHGLNVGTKQTASAAQCILLTTVLLIPSSSYSIDQTSVQPHSPPTSPQSLRLCLTVRILLHLVSSVIMRVAFYLTISKLQNQTEAEMFLRRFETNIER